MPRAHTEKQKTFEHKMQTEGSDGFACGPRPWEHWDESGSQDDNRAWEGKAQRIYPQQRPTPSLGDRLLSGLALIALMTLFVGIAGVYFSETPTQQQAQSGIQPPPIVVVTGAKPHTTQSAPINRKTAPQTINLSDLTAPSAGNTSQTISVIPAKSPATETPVLESDKPETAVFNEEKTAGLTETSTMEPTVVALNSPEQTITPTPDIISALHAKTGLSIIPASKIGNWVVNLSSYTRESTANRMLAKFEQQGIAAEIFKTTINEKPMYRIRVTGFRTNRLAKAATSKLKKQLGLNSVWVSRK